MPDTLPKPNIENILRIGDFTIRIIAYRSLTLAECKSVAANWLKSNRRKSFPKSGSVTCITTYGFDQ